ncbi:unnamed protein product (macronuclear) [Paramecium tetraurelia]|uniref:Transmembrane protein n=1 Tax=Paramecium tetraurelia TaxID=5888 RepID=A0DNE8_PARTE|nr:uncharacterized protein GSPATT00018761001 [Paramecium tetraurelia]CAK84565.1 unnamed protein product [Paramecium tetraurelia]|eukprot:XP_001451962.1 hypothetical protein (macronuclear) [Paramecium tetraurelia strain d4-2]
MRNIGDVGEKKLYMARILEAFLIFQITNNWLIYGFGENIYTQISLKYFQTGLSKHLFIGLLINYKERGLLDRGLPSVFSNQLQKKERELFCTNCRGYFKFIPNYQIFQDKFLLLINKFKFTKGAQGLKTHPKKGFIHHQQYQYALFFIVLNLNQLSQLFYQYIQQYFYQV